MRAFLMAATLLSATLIAGAAVAGPSSAVFANADGALPGNVLLSVQYGGGSTSLGNTISGNYDQTGAHDPTNTYYFAGVCGSSDGCLGDDLVRHDFVGFDVSGVAGTVTAATLMLYNPAATVLPGSGSPVAPGYISERSSLPFYLYEVTTPGSVVAGSTQDLGIFNELGSGTVLGMTTVSPADDGQYVNIVLDARAIADINAGGTFTVGGAVVPEPAAIAAFGVGLLALGVSRRRLSRHP